MKHFTSLLMTMLTVSSQALAQTAPMTSLPNNAPRAIVGVNLTPPDHSLTPAQIAIDAKNSRVLVTNWFNTLDLGESLTPALRARIFGGPVTPYTLIPNLRLIANNDQHCFDSGGQEADATISPQNPNEICIGTVRLSQRVTPNTAQAEINALMTGVILRLLNVPDADIRVLQTQAARTFFVSSRLDVINADASGMTPALIEARTRMATETTQGICVEWNAADQIMFAWRAVIHGTNIFYSVAGPEKLIALNREQLTAVQNAFRSTRTSHHDECHEWVEHSTTMPPAQLQANRTRLLTIALPALAHANQLIQQLQTLKFEPVSNLNPTPTAAPRTLAGVNFPAPTHHVDAHDIAYLAKSSRVLITNWFNTLEISGDPAIRMSAQLRQTIFGGTRNAYRVINSLHLQARDQQTCFDGTGQEVDATQSISQPDTICVGTLRLSHRVTENNSNAQIPALMVGVVLRMLNVPEADLRRLQTQALHAFFTANRNFPQLGDEWGITPEQTAIITSLQTASTTAALCHANQNVTQLWWQVHGQFLSYGGPNEPAENDSLVALSASQFLPIWEQIRPAIDHEIAVGCMGFDHNGTQLNAAEIQTFRSQLLQTVMPAFATLNRLINRMERLEFPTEMDQDDCGSCI